MTNHTLDASSVKVCSRCGETKSLTDYTLRKTGKQAGIYEGRCRACMRLATAEYRARHPERVKASAAVTRDKYRDQRNADYRKRLASDKEFRAQRVIKSRNWRDANRDAIAEYNAMRFRENPEMMRSFIKNSANRNPDRVRARKAVAYAVKSGKFPAARWMVCDMCDEALAAHWHHHNGYAPEHKLDVIAVCTECHGKAHQVEV